MVNVAAPTASTSTPSPHLREGVALLGGEPRARHLYAEPGAAGGVLAAWREVLGEKAAVLSRDQAIAAGWFGPVEPGVAARIGDVLAAAAGGTAIVALADRAARVGVHRHARLADHRRAVRAAARARQRVSQAPDRAPTVTRPP